MSAKRKSETINPLGPSTLITKNIVSAGSGGKEWLLRKILDHNYAVDQMLVCTLDHVIGPPHFTTPNPVVARWIEDIDNLEQGKAAGIQTYTFKMEGAAELGGNAYFPPGEIAGPNHPEDYIFSIVDAVGPTTHKIGFGNSGAVDIGGTGIFDLAASGIIPGYNPGVPAYAGYVTIKTLAGQPDLTGDYWKLDQGWIVDNNTLLQTYGFSKTLSDVGTVFDHSKKTVNLQKDKIASLVSDTICFDADIASLKLQVALLCSPSSHWKDNLTIKICTELGHPNLATPGIWHTLNSEVETDLVGNTILYRFKHDLISAIVGSAAPQYALTIWFDFDNTPQRYSETLVLGYAIGLAP